MLEWRSESSEIFVLSRRLSFFGLVCFGRLVYLDSYTMLFCFFEYGYICVLHLIFFEIFVSKIYISSIELLLLYKVYGIRFRSEIIRSS